MLTVFINKHTIVKEIIYLYFLFLLNNLSKPYKDIKRKEGYTKYKCLHPSLKVELRVITKNIGKKKFKSIKKSNISFFPLHKSLYSLFSFILKRRSKILLEIIKKPNMKKRV